MQLRSFEPKNCQLECYPMKNAGLKSALYKHIPLLLDQYSCQEVELKLFRARFVERSQTRFGKTF